MKMRIHIVVFSVFWDAHYANGAASVETSIETFTSLLAPQNTKEQPQWEKQKSKEMSPFSEDDDEDEVDNEVVVYVMMRRGMTLMMMMRRGVKLMMTMRASIFQESLSNR